MFYVEKVDYWNTATSTYLRPTFTQTSLDDDGKRVWTNLPAVPCSDLFAEEIAAEKAAGETYGFYTTEFGNYDPESDNYYVRN